MNENKHTVQYITIPVRNKYWSEAKRLANVVYDQHSSMLDIDEENEEITLRIVDPNKRTDSYVSLISRMCKKSALSCWVGPSLYTYGFIGGTRQQKAQAYIEKVKEVMMDKSYRFWFAQGFRKAIMNETQMTHNN